MPPKRRKKGNGKRVTASAQASRTPANGSRSCAVAQAAAALTPIGAASQTTHHASSRRFATPSRNLFGNSEKDGVDSDSGTTLHSSYVQSMACSCLRSRTCSPRPRFLWWRWILAFIVTNSISAE